MLGSTHRERYTSQKLKTTSLQSLSQHVVWGTYTVRRSRLFITPRVKCEDDELFHAADIIDLFESTVGRLGHVTWAQCADCQQPLDMAHRHRACAMRAPGSVCR